MKKRKSVGTAKLQSVRRPKMEKLDERALWHRIGDLRDDVALQGSRRFEAWHPSIVRRSFLLAAKNLAHYLALRAHDLSGVQVALSEHGLSSLGRCEPHVLSSLDAVIEALGRISGQKGKGFPPAGWNSSRTAVLTAQSEAIFGPDPTGPRKHRYGAVLPISRSGPDNLDARVIGDQIGTWR